MDVISIDHFIDCTFKPLYRKLGYIMSTVTDLQTDVQAVEDGVKALAVIIADLRANGAGPVSQAQLDALDTQAKAIVAAIAAGK